MKTLLPRDDYGLNWDEMIVAMSEDALSSPDADFREADACLLIELLLKAVAQLSLALDHDAHVTLNCYIESALRFLGERG